MQDFSRSCAYHTRMNARFIPLAVAACLLLAGCHDNTPPQTTSAPSPADEAVAANQLFLSQKTFDPWVLTNTDTNSSVPLYSSNGYVGVTLSANGKVLSSFEAGRYKNGQLEANYPPSVDKQSSAISSTRPFQQMLDLRSGKLTTDTVSTSVSAIGQPNGTMSEHNEATAGRPLINWPQIWQISDIVISGDPEAQQVTHANMFYLLSSAYPGNNNGGHSIPPMGLSSNIYGGHIFWDAEVWMMPASIAPTAE